MKKFENRNIASLRAKLTYLKNHFKTDLKNEEAFPGILNYSYRQIIRPR